MNFNLRESADLVVKASINIHFNNISIVLKPFNWTERQTESEISTQIYEIMNFLREECQCAKLYLCNVAFSFGKYLCCC